MDKLIAKVNITPERVLSLPSKIFLCGGAIPKDKTNKYFFLRHVIYEYINNNDEKLFNEIILAEDVQKWFSQNIYNDLLELEEDLAGLVSVIPLFLESPGSIAELGSFILLRNIPEKLVIILNSEHSEENSFIKLGPLQRFKNLYNHQEQLLTYSWKVDPKEGISKDDLDIITPLIFEAIKKIYKKKHSSYKFTSDITAHRVLLMCDIIDLMFVCRISEIETCLRSILNKDISREQLNKYLLIATKFNLIAKAHYGNANDTFYFAQSSTSNGFIDYNYYNSNLGNSRIRIKTKFIEHINKYDQKKVNARKQWLSHRKQND